jgi:type VI secretion system protein ImpC
MPDPRASVHIGIVADDEPQPLEVADDLPFRILVLADLTGRKNKELRAPLAGRRPIAIDRDNFDDVVSQLQPSLRLSGLDLRFTQLDDFHPDQLYERLPVFRKLAKLREQPPQPRAQAAAPPPNLLESIVEQLGSETGARSEDAADLPAFLKKVTASSLEPREDPGRQAWAARTDTATAELMRGILHHPAFQKLEAAWRAVAFLVNRLDTDGPLKIHVLDVTLEELLDDEAATYALLQRRGDPWSVIVGDFSFAQNTEDAVRLHRLARAARLAGAPFLAEALPPSGTTAPEWQAFRGSADAVWVGLTVPRFLLRLPYGPGTSPVERFAFEEMPHQEHARYLWGNPAFCCALLLGRAFLREGWQMRPGVIREIENLPLHLYKEDGQMTAKPCAEVLLTERDADYIMENGFMPLATLKSTDSVLLVRFQSVADPLRALGGRWRPSSHAASVE